MAEDQQWPEQVIASWVQQSCHQQGVPVKVSDPYVVRTVCCLLGVPTDPRRWLVNGARPAQRARRSRDTAASRIALQPPDRLNPGRVEASTAGTAGCDDGVVQNGGDDRGLPSQVKRLPRGA
jgi:hypothetical protein